MFSDNAPPRMTLAACQHIAQQSLMLAPFAVNVFKKLCHLKHLKLKLDGHRVKWSPDNLYPITKKLLLS